MLTKQKMSASMAPVLIVVEQSDLILLLSRFNVAGRVIVSNVVGNGGSMS
jgi:hypothetical protein